MSSKEQAPPQPHLTALFDNLGDAVFFLDRERLIRYVNPSGAKLFGYPVDDLLNQTPAKLYHDPAVYQARYFIFEHLDEIEALPLEEVEMRHQSGRVFPAEVSRSIVKEPTGRASGMLVILRDISQRQATQAALQMSQQFIERLNAASPHVVYVYNMQQRVNTYISSRIEQLLGYSVQEIKAMGTDLHKVLLHPDDMGIFPKWLAQLRAAQDDDIITFEQRYRHKNGQWRWCYMRQVVFSRQADGKPLELTGTMEDVTERKEAEIALQQASLELAISRHALQRIIQQLPIGIQTFTPDGLCSDVNQAHLTLFGVHSREQLVGQYNIFNDPLAIITGTHAAAQRALAGELVYMGDVHFNFEQFRTPWAGHDKMRVINVTILPIIDQHGSVVNIVGLNQDVTERYQNEQQHLQIVLQGERIKLLENLIRDISHDLRTPLTIIGTCLYLIRKTSTPDQQKYVTRIEFQVSRLVKLIDGLLTMSRLDQADSLHMKQINLATLIRNLVEAQMISAQDNQVALILELDQRDLYIQGDEDELNHALHHLVENGLTFTPAQGEVRVKAWGDLEQIYVQVSDTGVGIDPEDLPHIFERFYRADKARATDTGGSGLGLAIAKRVIEMHQGRIEVFSRPNQGSRFVVTMPRT